MYGGSPAPEEEDAIVERVNASGADILFVAYGAPDQDKWIARNLPRLRVKMAMGVGGSLDFVAGVIPRAPQWFQRLGLEWLYPAVFAALAHPADAAPAALRAGGTLVFRIAALRGNIDFINLCRPRNAKMVILV